MACSGCAAENAVFQKLSGKWKLDILLCLSGGKTRWNTLVRALPDAAPNALTRQLRKLEADGLVFRQIQNARPPYVVEYALTDAGRRLVPALQALERWSYAFPRETA